MRARDAIGMRPAHSRSLEVLREALPFSLVRRGRHVVGFWYVTDARFMAAEEGPFDGCRMYGNCRAMVRTEDGRVAGVSQNMTLLPDMGDVMLDLLCEASRETSAWSRRKTSEAFADTVRDTVGCVSVVWGAETEAYQVFLSHLVDGLRGWRHDDDHAETLAAIKALYAARASGLGRFLDTLDPILVGAMRPHPRDVRRTDDLDSLIGEAWPMLDETFGKGAPLRSEVVRRLDAPDPFEALEPILHEHAFWSRDHGRFVQEWDEDDRAKVKRRFMPVEPVDLTNVLVPGFG